MQLQIPSCLGYGRKTFEESGYNAQSKINVF